MPEAHANEVVEDRQLLIETLLVKDDEWKMLRQDQREVVICVKIPGHMLLLIPWTIPRVLWQELYEPIGNEKIYSSFS